MVVTRWRMPDESEEHARTWMAFSANSRVWGRRAKRDVQAALAEIACVIGQYEPVHMLVDEKDMSTAERLTDDNVELAKAKMDDIWVRDTGPLFVVDGEGGKAAVNFNFNGWGGKQRHSKDSQVAGRIAELADVMLLDTKVVMEGGCIEVDGQGTAIVTESCTLNKNRNKGMAKEEFEESMKVLLGVEKIIWLPGIAGKDLTDGHTDFYARFAGPGVVVASIDSDPKSSEYKLTREHLRILKKATDARGRRLDVHTLETPEYVRPDFDCDEFAAGYAGFYLCNEAVIMQNFGDRDADDAAQRKLQAIFPDRKVEALNVDAVGSGGGTLHCTMQHEPVA